MSRSDAEILDLLRSAKPDDAVFDAEARAFERWSPARSFTSDPRRGGSKPWSRTTLFALTVAAAVALVAVGVVAAVLVLRSGEPDTTLVPASQPAAAPDTTAASPGSPSTTDGAATVAPPAVRHTGDRRGETAKQYRDTSGAYAWFVQHCTNLRRGADLLAIDRAQTVCGPDEALQ